MARHAGRMTQDAGPEPDHWFEPIADHLGAAYLRYSFTMGTAQEVAYLVDALGLEPGMRVLDVGCGPGRHAHELARRGIACHGIDISERFVALARERRSRRARPSSDSMPEPSPSTADFDAVVSLCQGGFGLVLGAGEDLTVLEGMVRAARPGGRLAMTAFNAYFQVRHHTEASWDADAGVAHERTEVRDEQGVAAEVDLWTALLHAQGAPPAGAPGRAAGRRHQRRRAWGLRRRAARRRARRAPRARDHGPDAVVPPGRRCYP